VHHEKTEKKRWFSPLAWSNPGAIMKDVSYPLGVTTPNLKKKLAHVKVCH